MRQIIITTLSVVLIAALLGCGSPKRSDSTAGQKGAVPGSAKAGQESVAVPLAEGFPKDFPLIKGKVTACLKNSTVSPKEGASAGVGYYVQIQADATPREAMDYYKPKFTKLTKQVPFKKGSTAMYSGFIKNHPVNIYFIEQKNKTMVTIILSDGSR